MKNAITLGAKGLIFSPFDSSAAGTILKTAAAANVKVVAVDVATETGPVAIVVRADNVAYGEKACKYIGEHVAEGPVVQIMGDQASINGRDRGNGFRDCIKKNYPEAQGARNPDQGLVGRGRGGWPRHHSQLDTRPQGDLHACGRRFPRAHICRP